MADSFKTESATPWGKRLLIVVVALLAASCFELRSRLFQLGFLLRCQNGKCFLMELELFAHHFGLKARHFRQFLSSQCFVERTAFARLTQLLSLGSKLFAQGFVSFGEAFVDRLHLSFLVIS